MTGRGTSPYHHTDSYATRRRPLRSYRGPSPESEASESEPAANTAETQSHHTLSRDTSSLTEASHEHPIGQQTSAPLFGPITERPFTATTNHTPATDPTTRGRGARSSLFIRNRRRGGRESVVGFTPQGNIVRRRQRVGNNGSEQNEFEYEYDRAVASEHELLSDERLEGYPADHLLWPRRSSPGDTPSVPGRPSIRDFFVEDMEDTREELDGRLARPGSHAHYAASLNDLTLDPSTGRTFHRMLGGSTKRPRDWFENADGNSIQRTLNNQGAVAAMLYRYATPDPDANDVWPEFRSTAKLPARYYLLDTDTSPRPNSKSKRRPPKTAKKKPEQDKQMDGQDEELPDVPIGRPKWDLPVELVELIATYLSRDDIKSLRMVSQELNYYVSQVIFKTVVVPFNTEIYGMLGQGQKPDFKGKKRAKFAKPDYLWKNTNGDEVYNGHGLDVFKGFGKHILRYGMSFEVNEDSLAQPPAKTVTEKKTSFWGSYDWPFDEYRRFDAVAGLETAADETPRMKIAFSELTRVKELALSVDSGLGWLNGPDRSIRARILQSPPAVFGTLKGVPDRRAQAQQELWSHIEKCHRAANKDIRLAKLYRFNGSRPVSEMDEATLLAEKQPQMPYLDTHVIHEATPHETVEVPVPTSFDDPEVLDRFILAPSYSGAGILFSSITPPTDASQIMSPIIPASLTKAQKEWLLETEWAQRAFMSSYMLSIIDNPLTFNPVHTLNISRLSDRYLPTLNRNDFWDALPNLTNLTLLVIPGWRTVHKDEAGFVDTPRINPITGLDPFCELLGNHIATRSGIQRLTIGWIGGGEHAEGLFARNKLVMPAPLIPLGVRAENNTVFASEMMTALDPKRLRAALLHFPYVERLVLKNCWITPAALLQFVNIHDAMALRQLVLDSVSLTAILRPNGHANQAAQPAVPLGVAAPQLAGFFGANVPPMVNNNTNNNNTNNNNQGGHGALQAHPQPLPNNNNNLVQWLLQNSQGQLQQLQQLQANAGGVYQQNQIANLQAQLHNQIHLLHTQNQQQAQVPAPAPVQNQALPTIQVQTQATAYQQAVTALLAQNQTMHQQIAALVLPAQHTSINPQALLRSEPREGSWLNIIDIISPGTNLKDFGSDHSKADPERQTSLQSIEFISCGYAKLPYANFDQAAIEPRNWNLPASRESVFTKRHNALYPAMMSAKWAHLGEIVQEVDLVELNALDVAWNLEMGWRDFEEAQAAEFDGLLSGGTGRFTGKVQVSDRMRDGDEAGSAS